RPSSRRTRTSLATSSMREVVSNTSPLLYLHQLGSIHLLPALYSRVLVPASDQDQDGWTHPDGSALSVEANGTRLPALGANSRLDLKAGRRSLRPGLGIDAVCPTVLGIQL